MKTVMAVWMAAARQLLWKVLAIAAAMAVMEIGLFYRLVQREAVHIPDGMILNNGFGDWMDNAAAFPVFAAAFAILTVFLLLQGSDHRGKLGYTFRRLPISESAITLLWAAVHVTCYVVLWAVQLAVVLVCWRLYMMFIPGEAQLLELFVEFYLDEFLHGLLPMEHIVVWLQQILWILCMGTGTAWYGMQQRAGKMAVGPVLAEIVGLLTFRSSLRYGYELAGIMAAIYALMLACNLGRICRRAYEKED